MVIRPEREVDEDSSLGGNSHSSHLLRGEGGHFFQLNLFRAYRRGLQKQQRNCLVYYADERYWEQYRRSRNICHRSKWLS